MTQVFQGSFAGGYLSSGGAFIPDLFMDDDRFNITRPLRLALAQVLSDGKDILFRVEEPNREAHYRDTMVVHLFRKFGVPGFDWYGEVKSEPGPMYRPVLGVYGMLTDAPDEKVMLLTQDYEPWQIVRSDGVARPPFQSCVLV